MKLPQACLRDLRIAPTAAGNSNLNLPNEGKPVKRHVFSKLKQWKSKAGRKPLVLKGARQVGKTYVLKRFGQEAFHKFHYVNFEEDETLHKIFEENLKPKRILQELSFILDTSVNQENDLLIFDEIQACPRALTSLKYFQEKLPIFAVCAAGSLLGLQLGESAYPVGKVDYLEMFPVSFGEFLQASGGNRYVNILNSVTGNEPIPEVIHSHLWEQLKLYFIVGGLPEVVQTYVDHRDDLFKALQMVRAKQTDLIKGYIADIAKHSGKQNAMHLERIWKNIPTQLAREQNGSAQKFKFTGICKSYNLTFLSGELRVDPVIRNSYLEEGG